MSTCQLPSLPNRTTPAPTMTAPAPDFLRDWALSLMRTEIDFIPNREFRCENLGDPDFVADILAGPSAPLPPSVEMPAHLRRMCKTDLLTHEQETALFREMNHLKYRANALRSRIDPDAIDVRILETVESLLRSAQTVRDHIVQANMRLVMSIVKKFVSPQLSFDELLSDGVVTLIQVVSKFDYDRGFRFSTYAYRSIARNAYRTLTAARKAEARFAHDSGEWSFVQEDSGSASTVSDRVWSRLREQMTAMLDRLDRRERMIIRSRYALGSHRQVRTFQFLADKLGVSKERVRQLEQRAMAKLRAMAAELEMDDLFTAAMV